MKKALIFALAIISVAVVIAAALYGNTSLRAEPLRVALQPIIEGTDADQSAAARALLSNYLEQRHTAAIWSGVYWGSAWLSAVLSAFAGLVLKLESLIANDKIKRDVAALMAVAAALLITISTSGDFQRKWQATRAAAADIERDSYDFLEHSGKDARSYFGKVGDALHKRHQSILGTGDRLGQSGSPGKAASAPK